MKLWDYRLPKNFKPETESEWLWYLARKINYDDWKGLKPGVIKKLFPRLKKYLDPGKKLLLENFFR
jgi:hypothetical protein